MPTVMMGLIWYPPRPHTIIKNSPVLQKRKNNSIKNTADDGETITTMDTGQEEKHEVSDPATAIAADSFAISADAHPDGTMEG